MKVLVVEDEKKIASFVSKGLQEAGFVVDVLSNGDDAAGVLFTVPYDAVVLDIMLPGRDGLSLLKELRQRGIGVPVILLTARGGLEEKLEGLNMGADDYLAKPFFVEELLARIHAVTRRSSGQSSSLVAVGDLRLNLLTREVRRGDTPIELTPREFSLLELLARSPGRVFSRTVIVERIWDYHFDPGTNLVDVYIQRLRRKVDDGFADKLLETVRGVGYRMRN